MGDEGPGRAEPPWGRPRKAADELADRVLGAGDRAREPVRMCFRRLANTYPDAFLVQLVHRLRDQDPSIAPALEWLDRQLARQGATADAVVRESTSGRFQAA